MAASYCSQRHVADSSDTNRFVTYSVISGRDRHDNLRRLDSREPQLAVRHFSYSKVAKAAAVVSRPDSLAI